MKLTLITGNAGKRAEWERLLPDDFELETIEEDLIEIQSMSPAEITEHKARQAFELLNVPVVVEDVSAGIDRLGGMPGPFVKFFVQAMGNDALRQLAGRDGEPASVSCTVTYFDGGEPVTVEGVCKGSIVALRGEGGFGFDKTFVPNGGQKTYGEMTTEEKDTVSHRALAVQALVKELRAH